MPKFQQHLFMIAIEGKELIVTVTCKPSADETRFRKALYEIAIPREEAKDLTAEQMFEQAKEIFQSVKADL